MRQKYFTNVINFISTFGTIMKKFHILKNNMSIELNIKIKEVRKLRGFSQVYVAKKLGITQKAYSKIECGETQLNWKKIKLIAYILKLNILDLIDENKEVKEINLDGKFTDKTFELVELLIENRDKKISKLQEENQLLRNLIESKQM